MKPIKPKFKDTVKVEFTISKNTKEILLQYAKYTKYTESEIIDNLASEIVNDDKEFVKWLKSKRYKKKIDGLIFKEDDSKGLDGYEETNET